MIWRLLFILRPPFKLIFVKTRADYYSKVLGMSLSENPDSINQKEVKVRNSNTLDTAEFSFLLLVNEEDLNDQKEMVQKILSALGAPFKHVVTNLNGYSSDCIFSFGEVKAPSHAVSFPSLSEISKNSDLKKKLWDQLKGFKV